MIKRLILLTVLGSGFLLPSVQANPLQAADWTIPLAGNAFRTAPEPLRRSRRRGGDVAWSDSKGVFSVYFHVDRPAHLRLALQARVRDGRSTVESRVGSETHQTAIESTELTSCEIGQIKIEKAGYVRIDLRGVERTGSVYAELRDLLVSSDVDGLTLDYVKSNDGNMFYWGRRGPSVHLRYEVPQGRDLQFAYSEITVPPGQDPIGTYYMANGFSGGYFGFQVNSADERRVLFSIWSPFKTNNPREIPEDQHVVALAKGPDVHIGEFGNEGSGGQSYLVYPWKAGTTYRFLTEVKPDTKGATVFTCWFGDKQADELRLIASFRRPQTDTHLRGFHSFLESFSPTYGHIGRRAFYGNVWVRDARGQWHECTRARFSVDNTGRRRQRLDFTGGADGARFYMQNCGFFDETGTPGETFARESTASERPKIDVDSLPRG